MCFRNKTNLLLRSFGQCFILFGNASLFLFAQKTRPECHLDVVDLACRPGVVDLVCHPDVVDLVCHPDVVYRCFI